ncbi:MAG: hypothetical protein HYX94_06565 [Chloroflexi bacterium]|nr:hypothetical protein [Chloroflexota bacterium]
MIRSVRPTDLAALAVFNRAAFPNEAKTRSSIARQQEGALPLGKFLELWLSLEENRYTWIDVERGRIRGLVSVRNRWGQSVWEIDRLLLTQDGISNGVCLRLLNYLAAVGAEVGIQKVFLRLPLGSLLIDMGKQAGFFPYLVETFYRSTSSRVNRAFTSSDSSLFFRAANSADLLNVFHLYCASVPTAVRQAEAMTYEEWRETRDKASESRRRKEILVEKRGQLISYVQTAELGRVGQLDLLSSAVGEEYLDAIAEHAFGFLTHKAVVVSLVPDYNSHLGRLLETYGFESFGDYASLVRQLAVRMRRPKLVPVSA